MNSNLTGNGTTHIYYNVSITNNDTTGSYEAPVIDFNETRNQPYLSKPSDYFMSVVRFSVDTPTLPLMIPQPTVGSTDVNKLIYSVTMEYNGHAVQTYLSYVPQYQTNKPPPTPISQGDIENKYYWLYSYQHFIDAILNPAFQTCYTSLSALTALPSTNAPIVLWDGGSGTAVLCCDVAGYDQSVTNSIKIYFNTPLYTWFSSFAGVFYGTTADTGRNFLLEVYNNGFNLWKNISNGVTYIQVLQEYPTFGALANPVTAIVFTSALIPIVPELTAAPSVFTQSSSSFVSSGNNSNVSNILTDLEVPLTVGWETKPTINYAPTAEYRFTDLFGDSPVSALQITVFWKDRFSNLIPLTLAAGGSANIKILFRRKDFGSEQLLI